MHNNMHMHKNKKYTISGYYAHNMHTTCTQFAHNLHTEKTEQNIRYNNMQHTDNTEHSTENNAQNRIQNKTENSAHNYRTYSLDYYHEYAYIKNSDTIELYTILKENI